MITTIFKGASVPHTAMYLFIFGFEQGPEVYYQNRQGYVHLQSGVGESHIINETADSHIIACTLTSEFTLLCDLLGVVVDFDKAYAVQILREHQ